MIIFREPFKLVDENGVFMRVDDSNKILKVVAIRDFPFNSGFPNLVKTLFKSIDVL